jgi:pimeloyl-ACP methyl ester carboxylesterase
MQIAGLTVVGSALAKSAITEASKIMIEEMMVPASDADIKIFVRNKRPAEMNTFQPERTLLFVHGATYPASTAFDLALGGASWMDYIASRGYDVYLLDLRGYGRSTRPKEMAQKPEANGPIVRGDTAVARNGTTTCRPIWRRRCSHCWLTLPTNATSNSPKAHTRS